MGVGLVFKLYFYAPNVYGKFTHGLWIGNGEELVTLFLTQYHIEIVQISLPKRIDNGKRFPSFLSPLNNVVDSLWTAWFHQPQLKNRQDA